MQMVDRWCWHFTGMIRDDGGSWVKEDELTAAHAEIERLTTAHDTVCGALAAAIKRAETAEAERDRQYDENVHRIAEQTKAETERDANAKWLGELLASVHRDGGHYQSKHGDSKAVADAHMIVSRLHASDEIERLNETVENCRHDFKIELASRKKAEAEIERLTHLLDLSKKTKEAVLDLSKKTKEAVLDLSKKTKEAVLERAEKAEVEAEFFKSEIKLRNRIQSTNDTAADLLRRAEKAEAERDEALERVAAAYEAAAEKCDVVFQDGVGDLIRGIGDEIRALTPADAKAALESYGRAKVREGMQRAATMVRPRYEPRGNGVIVAELHRQADAILYETKKLS